MKRQLNLKAPLLLVPWVNSLSILKFEKREDYPALNLSTLRKDSIFLLSESMSDSMLNFLCDEKAKDIFYKDKRVVPWALPPNLSKSSDAEISWWLDMEKERINTYLSKSMRQPQIWFFGESSILKDFKLFFNEGTVEYIDPTILQSNFDVFGFNPYLGTTKTCGGFINFSLVPCRKGLLFNQ